MIILFLLFGLRGIIPIDLPKIEKVHWHTITKEEVYEVALKVSEPTIYSATTITLLRHEQGKRKVFLYFPDFNAAGLHPWKKTKYWGWKKEDFQILPIGYFLWKEGATGQYAVFLAFPDFTSMFQTVLSIVKRRNITNSYTYYRLWVGYKNGKISQTFDKEKMEHYYNLTKLYLEKKIKKD